MPYAAYPEVVVYKNPGTQPIQNLLWGDWIGRTLEEKENWIKVEARGEDGWIKRSDIQRDRVLEVNFIDVGQGDGCFIVTPNDEFIIIDAGQFDNMERFLTWRFNLRYNPKTLKPFKYGFITHPDRDHYQGFDSLFKNPSFRFETVYHNGIVERAGASTLGTVFKDADGIKYLSDVIATKEKLLALLEFPENRGSKVYPNMLFNALSSGRVGDFKMVCDRDGYLPDYENDKDLSFQVLGPVPQDTDTPGQYSFEVFGSDGITERTFYHS